MKKTTFLGLALFACLTNVADAAPTSLSTIGTWQTASGDLSSLIGQSAPATWSYNTDLTLATLNASHTLPSSANLNAYSSSNYVLSGTAAPALFDGNEFSINVIDNTVANLDAFTSDLITSMINKGLNPDMVGDAVLFTTTTTLPSLPDSGITESFSLYGLMVFDRDFFSSPVATLPTADMLLDNVLFTYAALTHQFNFEETGFASYIQTPSAVPVPAAVLMFAPALLGFLGLRRMV